MRFRLVSTLVAVCFLSASGLAQTPRVIPAPSDVSKAPADAARTKSGLATKVIKAGTGRAHPASDDLVTVQYTEWTTDGKMVDSSRPDGRPRIFPLNGAFPGFIEGVQMMVSGETRRMWIPETLTAATQANRPKGTLVFDVELVSFMPSPEKPPADVSAVPVDARKTASGLAYRVLTPGSGVLRPLPTSTVTVNYSGWTTDGRLFDSSFLHGEPVSFQLNRVIPGWTEGVALMVEGEKTRFWIPEDLAYKGQSGQPKGMLVFDVELIKIQ